MAADLAALIGITFDRATDSTGKRSAPWLLRFGLPRRRLLDKRRATGRQAEVQRTSAPPTSGPYGDRERPAFADGHWRGTSACIPVGWHADSRKGRLRPVRDGADPARPGMPVATTNHTSETMATVGTERVLHVHHWNDTLFSFRTTRDPSLRFRNGHFVMIGLNVEGKPLMRAYSVASANHEEHLEFFSIKVPNGPLTSRLQHLRPGDEIIVGRKPVGTLVLDDLTPGKHLYLLSTGTGLAPFLSIIKDPETYERFEKVVLVHGVRQVDELAYQQFIEHELPAHEFLGEMLRDKLIYYPTVTREPYRNMGRLTDLIESGKLQADVGLPPLDPAADRAMICGSEAMLRDTCELLDSRGFKISPRQGEQGDYVIERAFVER